MDKVHFSSLLHMKEMNLRFASVVSHTEQLSAVLVIHMVCEKILETWIEASSDNKDFFKNLLSLSFSNKLLIAKNFSLPNEIFLFIKELNSIRNKFAHDIQKTEVSEPEIEKLYSSLSGFIARHPSMDPKKSSVHSHGVEYKYTDNNNIKISLLFSCMYLYLLSFCGITDLK